MIEITVQGPPVAKKRPRFVRRGNFVGAYNPQETEEGRWLWEARQQCHKTPLEGPVRIEAVFYMPIPRSASKKRCGAMESGAEAHTKKPDLDNLVKFASDCLNGIAWKDDSQIVEMKVNKAYSKEPRTVIQVEEI